MIIFAEISYIGYEQVYYLACRNQVKFVLTLASLDSPSSAITDSALHGTKYLLRLPEDEPGLMLVLMSFCLIHLVV